MTTRPQGWIDVQHFVRDYMDNIDTIYPTINDSIHNSTSFITTQPSYPLNLPPSVSQRLSLPRTSPHDIENLRNLLVSQQFTQQDLIVDSIYNKYSWPLANHRRYSPDELNTNIDNIYSQLFTINGKSSNEDTTLPVTPIKEVIVAGSDITAIPYKMIELLHKHVHATYKRHNNEKTSNDDHSNDKIDPSNPINQFDYIESTQPVHHYDQTAQKPPILPTKPKLPNFSHPGDTLFNPYLLTIDPQILLNEPDPIVFFDASSPGNVSYFSIVCISLISYPSNKLITNHVATVLLNAPYISSFFAFKEAPPIIGMLLDLQKVASIFSATTSSPSFISFPSSDLPSSEPLVLQSSHAQSPQSTSLYFPTAYPNEKWFSHFSSTKPNQIHPYFNSLQSKLQFQLNISSVTTPLSLYPDIIITDSNASLHQYSAGLGVHIAAALDLPALGCAKKFYTIDGIISKIFSTSILENQPIETESKYYPFSTLLSTQTKAAEPIDINVNSSQSTDLLTDQTSINLFLQNESSKMTQLLINQLQRTGFFSSLPQTKLISAIHKLSLDLHCSSQTSLLNSTSYRKQFIPSTSLPTHPALTICDINAKESLFLTSFPWLPLIDSQYNIRGCAMDTSSFYRIKELLISPKKALSKQNNKKKTNADSTSSDVSNGSSPTTSATPQYPQYPMLDPLNPVYISACVSTKVPNSNINLTTSPTPTPTSPHLSLAACMKTIFFTTDGVKVPAVTSEADHCSRMLTRWFVQCAELELFDHLLR